LTQGASNDAAPQPYAPDRLSVMLFLVWRLATPADDDAIVRMCVALNVEDPGPHPVPPEHTRKTLTALREVPSRGRAIALELDGHVCGYALLMAYWSNELGGEVCAIDELYVEREYRGRRHATRLIDELAAGTSLWSPRPVALALEVTPNNVQARRLYERAGFRAHNLAMRRRLLLK